MIPLAGFNPSSTGAFGCVLTGFS